MLRVTLLATAVCFAPGCAVMRKLDDWSRPGIRMVDLRDIGPEGLPNAKRKSFVNKFIVYSEVPVGEFYGLPYYTSRD